MLEQKPLLQLAEQYDRLISHATSLNRTFEVNKSHPALFPGHLPGEPYCIRFVFSDSIILIANEDDPVSCLKLMVHVWRLVQATLAERMPIRGAIACGEMYFDQRKSIFLGPALTRAYELEQQQDWIGVAIEPSVSDAYPEVFPAGLDERSIYESLFLQYEVPLKDGSRRRLRTVNWRWNLVVEHGTRWLFPGSSDAADQIKIKNTLDYAAAVVGSGRIYADDQGKCPAELRAFWIGRKEPPFSHGDTL